MIIGDQDFRVFEIGNLNKLEQSYFELPHILKENEKKDTSLAALGALAHRLQNPKWHRRTACNTSPPASMRPSKIQNGRQGPPKWQKGSGKGCPLGFWALPSNFAK